MTNSKYCQEKKGLGAANFTSLVIMTLYVCTTGT